MNKLIATLLLITSVSAPQRPPKAIIEEITTKTKELTALATELTTALPVFCPQTCDLQATLNAGGIIEFEGTHTAPDRFTASVPGTVLFGRPGAKLIGGLREAIVVPPGAHDIELTNFEAASLGIQSVIRIGANDSTQTSTSIEPYNITLRNVKIPTHRGKRGFEINARDVLMEDCEVRDTWSTALADSQGIAIYNSSGSIVVRGGYYAAGSENVLIGGDTMKMVGTEVTNVIFENVTLHKPLSWKTDGINRVVKNLFELKRGNYITLRNSTLDGSWVAAQTGFAIVLTPTWEGRVTNITIEDSIITNVGAGVQILGRSYAYFTPARTSLTFQRNNVTINHTLFGGTGRLATIEAEPDFIRFFDNTWTLTGTSLITFGWGTVMEKDGSKHAGGPMTEFTMTGNTGSVRQYGLNFLGYPNCGPTQQGFAAALNALALDVNGNIFSNATTLFKTNFPINTWN